jgi:hypothetical protein
MSDLTDELDYVVDWVEAKNLDFFDYYRPGLNFDEIDSIVQELPFVFPDEFYELY